MAAGRVSAWIRNVPYTHVRNIAARAVFDVAWYGGQGGGLIQKQSASCILLDMKPSVKRVNAQLLGKLFRRLSELAVSTLL